MDQNGAGSFEGAELSFTWILATLSRERMKIVISVLCTVLIATGVAFLIPPKYTAEAVILTPQQSQSSLSSMAQVAGGASDAGLSGLSLLAGFGLRNPSDLYVGILQSRNITDALITRFNLREVYHDEYYKSARKQLKANTTIKAGKDTLIHIEVSDRNPNRAAQLANAYVEELSKQSSSVALTEASQRRMFFEAQLAKEKDVLADSEIAMRDTQQFTGLVVPTGQAEALIRSTSQLRAEIVSRHAQVAGMNTIAADDNPRFVRAKRELSALRSELAGLEQGEHVAGTPSVPISKLPQAGLEYVRKYRDVKYHETLYEALARQYEAARLDEAKSAPFIQVLDQAVVPETRSWPPRTILILVSSVLAALVSSLCILVRETVA